MRLLSLPFTRPRRFLPLLAALLACAALGCTGDARPAALTLAAAPTAPAAPPVVGPRALYLALGDSLAYGVQPNFTVNQGYTDLLFGQLRGEGTEQLINFACPGETTATMLNGGCLLRPLRKVRYEGSQIDAAIAFIAENRGKVSPVTLTIGVNDVIEDIGPGCRERREAFAAHLKTMAANLDVIISRLATALDGQGDLVVTLYYNPFESACPNTATYLAQLNGVITTAARRHGAHIADPSPAFAGRTCDLTWFCTRRDTHANTAGYQLIADTILGLLR